ncbi:hypothetical protein CLOACE_00350 [Clostridium acetireducens DSM 10703]|jgi:F0F1-type ATP synthase membrane subunit b/b'|uniref:ATPase n=1 Tax=Clostridium acetireducens DSM 10703 TaxID=1121290 RepID=A0A1E8F221_9CLOT|nr:ATPase [Clostridium acetireducens]OFI07687.1 hypothetical protein CLOACE_00350 [Clostridium acetireducens DSM 10703]
MRVIKLIEYLVDIIETSNKAPFSGKVKVNKKEILSVLDQIINSLPDELKKAQWIVEEKDRILKDAIKEAEIIKNQNIEKLRREIENHDIAREAVTRAEEIVTSAQKDASNIRNGAKNYAEEVINELEKEINSKSKIIIENFKNQMDSLIYSLEEDFNETSKILKSNINDLRNMK